MKVRYKITFAFVILTITLLVTFSILIYFITVQQQERDFNKRLENRCLTVATLLTRLPVNGYEVLSKIDSSTTNMLLSENISVFNRFNERLYFFSREHEQPMPIDLQFLNQVREKGIVESSSDQKAQVGIYYEKSASPLIIITSAINQNSINNLRELRKSLFSAFIVATILSLLVGWFFSRRLLRPIEEIATTVDNISANNIEKRLPEFPVNDEWNKLSVTFNNLLHRLQESFEIQGRFISNASHELSTPLTSVINQIDVTLQKSRTNEEYLEILQSVQSDAQHMTDLTQQLLVLARTSRGGALQTTAIRVDEIIMELPSLLKKISTEYSAQVFFDELPDNEDLSTVDGNYELLLSAFQNIAENGCKYSPDHTVNISLSFIDARIIVLFTNKSEAGNTIEMEKIFQPFQRGINAMGAPGYGLGLSLTRRIILVHRGEIKAELNEDDQMVVSVILPSSRIY
ncbi:MAG: histidine kinase dimerization/phospho-acceptor domain-containing protein [Sediminibacterium sp.]